MADTIYALASGAGRAAIAVIRVSGAAAAGTITGLTRRPLPPPRRASLRRLYDARGDDLDDALVLWFPAPHSATGEDVAEYHIHGGRATLATVMAALSVSPDIRLAEPGEFSRRAFLNRKLDLTAAEGLADLVAAETEAQRRAALSHARGELAAQLDAWRARILELLALSCAALDFADEDLPEGLEQELQARTRSLAAELGGQLALAERASRIRDGIEVAVIGPPNAGKSSLVNALARREVAIVSSRPGTTRDIIEVPLAIAGFPVVLCDTAGLRDGGDAIEAEGVRRAGARAASADIRIIVSEATASGWEPPPFAGPSLRIASKADLLRPAAPDDRLPVSVVSGEGLAALLEQLAALLERNFGASGVAAARQRHREGLARCHAALLRSLQHSDELAGEELRIAADELGRLTGRIDVERVLDVVFREFCIGK
jgi:tRNA modification GTPase